MTATLPALPDGHGHGGDGYDWMDLAEDAGWSTLALWGNDGWDAGQWPYVIMSVCKQTGDDGTETFGFSTYVEGDTSTEMFATRLELWARISKECAWYWRAGQSDGPKDLPPEGDPLPIQYRVPCGFLDKNPDFTY